jgi:hypothetical protein
LFGLSRQAAGKWFVLDEDNSLLAFSAHPLNAGAAALLQRRWARESDTILAYRGEELVMGANVGWLCGVERWATEDFEADAI